MLSPLQEKFPFPAKLLTQAGKKLEIGTEEVATALVDALRPLPFVVTEVKRREKKRNPAAPFITSTLQQEASKQMRFSASRTMRTAQNLYEGLEIGRDAPVGLITYMRTDSTAIAKEAQAAARELIQQRYGAEFLPSSPPQYKNRKNAQEAHEAIRPSYVDIVPEEIEGYLNPDQFKLYRLIWRRFMASQMKPAVFDVTSVDIAAGEFGLRASGSIIKFAGFLTVYEEARDEDKSDEVEADDENADRRLPELSKNQPLNLEEILPRQHFTQPPPRFTEATLVKSLEENGIGRPSTYASILHTIVDREYATLDQRRFTPTELGFLVNDKLVEHFGGIVNVGFTSNVEEQLDDVEEGKRIWTEVLRSFYDPFHADVVRAKTEMVKVEPTVTEFPCPTCGAMLLKKRGRFGTFLSCPNYPDCNTTMNISAEGQPVAHVEKPVVEVEGIEPGTTQECDKCGKDMVVRASARGAFWGCTGYPKCKNLIPIEGAKIEGMAKPAAEITEFDCPNCDRKLSMRKGRFGPFLGCSGYPDCKTIVKLDKEGKPKYPEAGEDAPKAAPKAKVSAAKAGAKSAAAKAPAKKAPAKKVVATKIPVKKTATVKAAKKEAA